MIKNVEKEVSLTVKIGESGHVTDLVVNFLWRNVQIQTACLHYRESVTTLQTNEGQFGRKRDLNTY